MYLRLVTVNVERCLVHYIHLFMVHSNLRSGSIACFKYSELGSATSVTELPIGSGSLRLRLSAFQEGTQVIRRLVVCNNSTFRILDPTSRSTLYSWSGTRPVSCWTLGVYEDKAAFVAGGDIVILSCATFEKLLSVPLGDVGVAGGVALSANYCTVAGRDGFLLVDLRPTASQAPQVLSIPFGAPVYPALMYEHLVVVGDNSGTVYFIDLETKALARRIKEHTSSVCELQLAGGYLFSGAGDCYLKVWKLD